MQHAVSLKCISLVLPVTNGILFDACNPLDACDEMEIEVGASERLFSKGDNSGFL